MASTAFPHDKSMEVDRRKSDAAEAGPSTDLDVQLKQLLGAVIGLRDGDFSVRLPSDWSGTVGHIASALNQALASGHLSLRANVSSSSSIGQEWWLNDREYPPAKAGGWVDTLMPSLEDQKSVTVDALRSTEGVAKGCLSQKLTVDTTDQIPELQNTLAKILYQLNKVVTEVNHFTKEICNIGELGTQANKAVMAERLTSIGASLNSICSNIAKQSGKISVVKAEVLNEDSSRNTATQVADKIIERLQVQRQIWELNEALEQKVKERTEEMRESAVLLNAAVGNASVGLVIIDRQQRYKFANSVYMNILGVTEDITGRTPAEFFPPAHYAQIVSRLERAFAGERLAFDVAMAPREGDSRKTKYYSAVYEPDRDSDGTIVGAVVVIIDITAHKETEEHIQFLMNEVNHRSKNLLSVVMAIAKQTAASSPQEFSQRFAKRLQALSVSHDLLIRNRWNKVKISELLREQLRYLDDLIGQRIRLEGPTVLISAAAAESFGMIIHELSTNAMKYGALSSPNGVVDITWDVEDCDGTDRFKMTWVESGGPPVVAQSRQGFGSKVITQMAEKNLSGETSLEFAASGLIWSLTCPSGSVIVAEAGQEY